MPHSYRQILDAGHQLNRDFRVVTGNLENIGYCLLAAPHGGSIEPGTTEIMLAVANLGHWAYYSFKGLMPSRNWRALHIPSTQFDERTLLALLPRTRFVLTFHGERGVRKHAVYVGGLYEQGRRVLIDALGASTPSFEIIEVVDVLSDGNADWIAGRNPNNIANRGAMGMGIQLEFSQTLRRSLLVSLKRSRSIRAYDELGILAKSIHRGLCLLTRRQ